MIDPAASGKYQSSQRKTAADNAHLASMSGKIIKIWGLIGTRGTGEAVLDIEFPVVFLELPSFADGASLDEGQTIELGSYPTHSITVHSFVYDSRPSGPRYYKGAKLILVSTGLDEQRMTFHYQFEGRAIVPPVRTNQIAEDTI